LTAKRQFCPRGHDTFECGRDSSYRCKACKREAGNEARWAREAEAHAVRRAEFEARQAEKAKRYAAERKRVLAAGGPDAKQFLWEEQAAAKGLCQWEMEPGYRYCMRKAQNVYCARHNRILEERTAKRKAELAPPGPEPEPEEKPEPEPVRDFWRIVR
jgi:hypothetical protein